MFENLTEHAQRQIMGALYESAATHAELSGGFFVAYEPDLKRFGYQSLSANPNHYRLNGEPLDPGMSDAVAATVDKRYAGVPGAVRELDSRTGVVTQIGHVLASGQNVVLGSEHGELVDVPFGLVGVSNRLREQGVAHRSGMIVSKAIDFLGINAEALPAPIDVIESYLGSIGIAIEDDGTIPARSFLRIAAEVTYFTVPSTQSFKNIRKLQQTGIRKFNEHVSEQIAEDMDESRKSDQDPLLFMIALPGTVNKLLDKEGYTAGQDLGGNYQTVPSVIDVRDDRRIEVVGSISPGVARFLGRALTYATVVRLDELNPKVAIDKDFVCVSSAESVLTIASKLVNLAGIIEPEKLFAYDTKGNLPLLRKR